MFERLGGMSNVQVGVFHSERERCSFCTGKNGAFLGFFQDEDEDEDGYRYKPREEDKNYFLVICWNCSKELQFYLNKSDFLEWD